MISRDQMFGPMLSASPSFAPAWKAFCAEWQDEELPLTIALGDLARHLIEEVQAGSTDEFPAIFQVVEQWHVDGDSYVREAAVTGLLEGIQNIAGHQGIDAGVFRPWLLPETKRWWDKLNAFWDGNAQALRDL